MSEIQKARDVLAKWRTAATNLPWKTAYSDAGTVRQYRTGYPVGDNVDDDDARLIVGTAGNSDFLDELDAMFRDSIEDMELGNGRNPRAERFAAHIIVANERMSA